MSTCLHCHEEIGLTERDEQVTLVQFNPDTGKPTMELAYAHAECQARQFHGGIGHHIDHHYWCEQKHDQDAGRSIRQSALEVTAGHYGWN